MKKFKKSQFQIGENVIMTNNFHRFFKGQAVTIKNNEKVKIGSNYTVKVEDARHIEDDVPTKYLRKIK